MTRKNSRKIIRKVLLIFHILKEIKKYILPTFQNTTNTNLKKILFPVRSLLKFFSKCPGRYIIFFCLKSYSLLLNMISSPFVLILCFFTFIFELGYCFNFISLLWICKSNNVHAKSFLRSFIRRFLFILYATNNIMCTRKN